ncbi:MAG TPA: peptidoglycan DD-metalloendopeptidase family protein [Candidatus Paceibacterota bacterium]|nr:peptidoglycan DD-metalloendopeptidase family protein [Candidatus Paceibacterota bacterium]
MTNEKPPSSKALAQSRNAYWIGAALVATALVLSLLILLLPRTAGAFWPFNVSRAQVTDTMTHDSEMPILKAAVNLDPDPEKSGYDLTLSGDAAILASVGPDGTVAPSFTDVSQGSGGHISTYTVKKGDNISEIASRHGVSVNTILWANNVKSANLIKPGDELLILPVSGLQYTVRSGDTIAGIAKKYGADAEEVALFNGLESSADLKAGSDIIVPGGTLAKKPSSTARSSSSGSNRSLPAVSGYFGNPVPGGRLTQGLHGYNGVDIGAKPNAPIYAAAAGTIIVARNNGAYNGGYGNYIVIKHGNGTQTLYAHMSKTAVSGGSVAKGDLIGYVGNTGRSTGPHLHFEVRGAKNPLAN